MNQQIQERQASALDRAKVALAHGAHAIDADDVRELLAMAHHGCQVCDCGGSGSGIVGVLPTDGSAVHYEPCTRCGGLEGGA